MDTKGTKQEVRIADDRSKDKLYNKLLSQYLSTGSVSDPKGVVDWVSDAAVEEMKELIGADRCEKSRRP
jgi:hypothetical protein